MKNMNIFGEKNNINDDIVAILAQLNNEEQKAGTVTYNFIKFSKLFREYLESKNIYLNWPYNYKKEIEDAINDGILPSLSSEFLAQFLDMDKDLNKVAVISSEYKNNRLNYVILELFFRCGNKINFDDDSVMQIAEKIVKDLIQSKGLAGYSNYVNEIFRKTENFDEVKKEKIISVLSDLLKQCEYIRVKDDNLTKEISINNWLNRLIKGALICLHNRSIEGIVNMIYKLIKDDYFKVLDTVSSNMFKPLDKLLYALYDEKILGKNIEKDYKAYMKNNEVKTIDDLLNLNRKIPSFVTLVDYISEECGANEWSIVNEDDADWEDYS